MDFQKMSPINALCLTQISEALGTIKRFLYWKELNSL